MSKKETPVHLDFFGREIAENDAVIYSQGNTIQLGRVGKLNNKMIRVYSYDYVRRNWRTGETRGDLQYSSACVKVDDAEVTMYLLKKQIPQ